MAEKEKPAALAGADWLFKEQRTKAFVTQHSNSDSGVSNPPVSRTTIERFRVGDNSDRETERITIEGGDFLEVSFVDHQPGASEDNSDRYTFKLTTPGGQQCEVDGREVDAVEFTIVGNLELAAFLSGMAELSRLRRK